ncbi:substrate-binding domain-containing protein [Kitasatospora sp. NPDC059327]|uniref:substrate-binding domain-containing protein n=1 Tax=Kitasatospora sp. NPDC059327 TaxID=3346803 RepID=UPI0036B03AB3
MDTDVKMVDPLDALHSGREEPALRVGLVVPQSGPLGLTGPSALDGALLAAHEVNSGGGVRGLPLELVPVDGGAPPPAVAGEVSRLLAAGAVDALAGCHSSDVHRAVEAVTAGRAAYVYTPPHEGGPRRPGVVCTGLPPMRQLGRAMVTVTDHHRLRRWALIGNDYIWPRSVHRAAGALLARTPARVVLERRIPLGGVAGALEPLLAELRSSRADGLLLSLIGRDLVHFNRALRRSGLDRRLVRLSGALEENSLLAYGGDDTGTLYAAMPSFASLGEDRRQRLTERHRAVLGPHAPVLDAYAAGLYDGIHLLAALSWRRPPSPHGLARAAGRLLRADDVTARRAWARAPLGPPREHAHLARVEGLDFTVIPLWQNPSIWK